LWLANRESAGAGPTGPLWLRGLWLEAVLARLRDQLDSGTACGADVFERLAAVVEAQQAAGLALSLLPYSDPTGR
jgi:hypothetical protein